MSVRIEGEFRFNVSEHDEDLYVLIDNASDLYDLMCDNGISEEDMLEYFSDDSAQTHRRITKWLKSYADVATLCDISRTCVEVMLEYWNQQHSARVEQAIELSDACFSNADAMSVRDKPNVDMPN